MEEFSLENIKNFINCFEAKIVEGQTKYVCVANSCGANYTAKSSAIRHLQSQHKDIYTKIKGRKTGETEYNLPADIDLRVKVNLKEIWNACIELIIFNALPLRIVEQSAFKKLLKPYVVALANKNIQLNITVNSIKKKIFEKASTIKEIITNEAHDKYFSVMIDIAYRYNRSVLGINILYFSNGCTHLRTIGMHTIRASQSSIDLFKIIKVKLDEHSLKVNKIIAFTTDNGKNMLKTVQMFDEFEKDAHNQALMNYQMMLDGIDSDEEMDEEIFDETYYGSLLDGIRNEFQLSSASNQFIYGIKCGLHCLHLVITNAMRDTSEIKNVLEKVRTLVKKLRTPKYRSQIQSEKLNIPIIDIVTRWNSIHDMV